MVKLTIHLQNKQTNKQKSWSTVVRNLVFTFLIVKNIIHPYK